jgi:hypothetical protein
MEPLLHVQCRLARKLELPQVQARDLRVFGPMLDAPTLAALDLEDDEASPKSNEPCIDMLLVQAVIALADPELTDAPVILQEYQGMPAKPFILESPSIPAVTRTLSPLSMRMRTVAPDTALLSLAMSHEHLPGTRGYS